MTINFTNDELYWIEREADIQSSIILSKFFDLVRINKEQVDDSLKPYIVDTATEFIELYLMLKGLRLKLEKERKGE